MALANVGPGMIATAEDRAVVALLDDGISGSWSCGVSQAAEGLPERALEHFDDLGSEVRNHRGEASRPRLDLTDHAVDEGDLPLAKRGVYLIERRVDVQRCELGFQGLQRIANPAEP